MDTLFMCAVMVVIGVLAFLVGDKRGYYEAMETYMPKIKKMSIDNDALLDSREFLLAQNKKLILEIMEHKPAVDMATYSAERRN